MSLFKKTRHQTLAHNFTKYWPILKILSLFWILKIGQYLVKLWARVWCLVFFDSRCRFCNFINSAMLKCIQSINCRNSFECFICQCWRKLQCIYDVASTSRFANYSCRVARPNGNYADGRIRGAEERKRILPDSRTGCLAQGWLVPSRMQWHWN